MNKEAGRRYNAKPAAIQSLINDLRRAEYDNHDREQMADEAEFWQGKKEVVLGRQRPPGIVKAIERMNQSRNQPPEDKGPRIEDHLRERPKKTARGKTWSGIDETLDQIRRSEHTRQVIETTREQFRTGGLSAEEFNRRQLEGKSNEQP